MTQLTETSQLVRTRKVHYCQRCGQRIPSGTTAQNIKWIGTLDGEFCSGSGYEHSRCHYVEQRRRTRFERFQQRCQHPEPFVVTEWSGGTAPSPDYDTCTLCKQKV